MDGDEDERQVFAYTSSVASSLTQAANRVNKEMFKSFYRISVICSTPSVLLELVETTHWVVIFYLPQNQVTNHPDVIFI